MKGSGSMAKNMEVELKLVVAKDDLKKMLALESVKKVIRKGSRIKRRLISSYYDTDDFAFKEHGIAYRVRDKGDGSFEATVKTNRNSSGGLSERMELNLALPTAEPVLEGFAELGLEEDLHLLAPDGIRRLFTVNVDRTTYILDLEGAVAELAIDHGKITAGRDGSDMIEEIEIELLEGNVDALMTFAAGLAANIPLFPEKRSKFVRGLALRGISTEKAMPKIKFGEGVAHQEVLQIVQQRGDALLDAQYSLRNDGFDDDGLKNLSKQLRYLRSYMALVQELGDYEKTAHCLELLDEKLQVVERIRHLRYLKEQWEELLQESSAFNRNSLQKRLLKELQEAEAALTELVSQGAFTHLYYEFLAMLLGSTWENEEYMQGGSMAKACVYAWSVLLEEEDDEPRASRDLENIYYLTRSMQGKEAEKSAQQLKKKLRRQSRKQNLRQQEQLLLAIGASGTSKILHRDMGALLGWLIARA